MDYEKLMAKARKTNAKRDASERASGFTPETEQHPFVRIRTAMMAIKTAITTDDWNEVAEAQAILETVMSDIDKATKQRGGM